MTDMQIRVTDGLSFFPDSTGKELRSDRLQTIFESLIKKCRTDRQAESRQSFESIPTKEGIITQDLFAQSDLMFPIVGVRLNRVDNGEITNSAEYSMMVDHYDRDYLGIGINDIFLVTGMIGFAGQGQSRRSPVEDYGQRGEEILKRFDEPMLQAMANQSQQKILRSVIVEEKNLLLKDYLVSRGYKQVKNNKIQFFKIYEPR